MAYSVKTIFNFTGLLIADDRFGAFEEIRQFTDPLMKDRRAPSKPIDKADFFCSLPAESTELLHLKRLHTMIEHTKRQEAADQITAEQERKKAAKISF